MVEHVLSGMFILDYSNVIVPRVTVESFVKIPMKIVRVKMEVNVITMIMTEPH